jgi:hypothetical protein
MKIQDFNRPGGPIDIQPVAAAPTDASGDQVCAPDGLGEGRASVEIALLKAQIEHLELVVETARSLMTSNQERLLRRLHDLPREMAVLASRLERLDHPGQAGGSGGERNRSSIRRVV